MPRNIASVIQNCTSLTYPEQIVRGKGVVAAVHKLLGTDIAWDCKAQTTNKQANKNETSYGRV